MNSEFVSCLPHLNFWLNPADFAQSSWESLVWRCWDAGEYRTCCEKQLWSSAFNSISPAMPGETFSMLGQENISIWFAGLFVCGNTVSLELPEMLELDEIPSLPPWRLWGTRKVWWSLVNNWGYRFSEFIFSLCGKLDGDDLVNKGQEKSLKFSLGGLAHATLLHPFKHVPLPLSSQLARLWDASVSSQVNGLS